MITAVEKELLKSKNIFVQGREEVVRLYNPYSGEMKGFSIDLYKEYTLIQYFTDEINLEKIKKNIPDIVQIYKNNGFSIRGIYLKNRQKNTNNNSYDEIRKSELIWGKNHSEDYSVVHCDCKFHVDLISSQHTGIFADMRNVRKRLEQYYQNDMRMLNLFCYTGAFSIHALLNGIASSVNVDLSKNILRKAEDNYIINKIKYDKRDFLNMDANKALNYFIRNNRKFDIVVFDPPTFSRNKKSVFSIEKDYTNYIDKIFNVLNEGGILLSAINSYKISKEKYFEYHQNAFENIFYESEANDFKNIKEPYLKVGLWKKIT